MTTATDVEPERQPAAPPAGIEAGQRAARDPGESSAEEAEILDREGLDPALVDRSLVELQRVNRWLQGYRPLLRTLLPRLAEGPPRQWLVDVGTGSGDAAHRLARRLGRRSAAAGAARRRLEVVGVDRKLAHLLSGRRRGIPQRRVVADARALPFRDGAVDWCASTLFFHHFGAEANARIVSEMRRVARRGAAVVDLRRNRFGRWLGRVLIPLTGAGWITRHDGRVSLERCWSFAEVRAFADRFPECDLRRRFPFRFALVVEDRPPARS